jgi:predicted aspartyl protease
MKFVNCAVEENKPIPGVLDTGADINVISHKYISELGITYNSENNSIKTPDASYSTLGKVNLRIIFNNGKKYKTYLVNL